MGVAEDGDDKFKVVSFLREHKREDLNACELTYAGAGGGGVGRLDTFYGWCYLLFFSYRWAISTLSSRAGVWNGVASNCFFAVNVILREEDFALAICFPPPPPPSKF